MPWLCSHAIVAGHRGFQISSEACASSRHQPDVVLKVEYLPPMTTVFPKTTQLSRAVASGYPPGHSPSKRDSEFGSLWAFAVTSQNAVSAVEAALQHQPDAAIREAWLRVPIYCLTGATLARVKEVGFVTINPSDTSGSSYDADPASPAPSFDNAAQLVDFLISFKWPTSVTSASSTVQVSNHSTRHETEPTSDDADQPFVDPTSSPKLWFLTGETRMKTLAEKLSAYQRAFQEVVVYETGPRPGFEEELSRWFADNLDLHSEDDIASHGVTERRDVEAQIKTATATDKPTNLWLIGFSPKGVDLTVPVLNKSLESCLSSTSSSFSAPVQIQWGSIGPTTATRIQEHLLATANISKSRSRVFLSSIIAVAKAPKPTALAEAIASHPST
ncbi:hypothetical protein KI688_009279 [Linnemannia hyalina]|uniref:Uroporphyrinogen-III synthase n=1 Tax=Linnemannia hyalina TaxID=64524 RepID=A0A9P7Y0K3_9FUNG|nr:hypothetical protein KI688_009279 [Linnemannia hyalina]